MTSRRSEDNPTTDDWLAQRNGEYYDSIWPVDSQGRRIPPSTQITVIPSSSILDTARAAQAANREKLDLRDNNLLIEKEAVRRIKKDREKEQKDEEGKIISRGVTEGSYYTVLPKRKFGGFGWIIQEHLGVFYQDKNATNIVSETNVVASGGKLSGTLFQSYRLYTPLIYSQDFALPASHVVFNGPPKQGDLIKCEVLQETKNSVLIRVHGSITAPGTPVNRVFTQTRISFDGIYDPVTMGNNVVGLSVGGGLDAYKWNSFTGDETNFTGVRYFPTNGLATIAGTVQRIERHTFQVVGPQYSDQTAAKYYFQVGVFFGKSSISRPSYCYFFHKNNLASEETIFEGGNWLLSELASTTTYPSTSVSGSPDKVSIRRIEITSATKQAASTNLTDVYGQPVQNRTFESEGVGNLTFVSTKIDAGYEASTTNQSSTTGSLPYQHIIIVDTATFTPKTITFDETIEIIMTEKDYGPLE